MKNHIYPKGMATCFAMLFSILFSTITLAQPANSHGIIAQKVKEYHQKGLFKQETEIFSVSQNIGGNIQNEVSKLLKQSTFLNARSFSSILQAKPDFLNFLIPVENGKKAIRVLLFKQSISPNGFRLISSDGQKLQSADAIVHYRGSVENDDQSVAAFSFSSSGIAGIISNGNGNYVIGKIEDNSGIHIIYNDKDLYEKPAFDCGTNTSIPLAPGNYYKGSEATASLTAKCVDWYWETDYDLFVIKDSVAGVNNYMQGIFNQVSTLYANDGISITLRTLFIWSTTDPYTGPSTSDYLNQFGVNRTSFDGDLANLIGTKGGGGIAWINGLCNSQNKYKMSYAGINSSYNNVPSYSWTVEVITHEEGHLLGSRHTHDCAWNGNNTKIDGCGDAAGYPSGTCAVPSPALPPGGGTIMSYCHLTSAGINFNLGFGPQPKALIINNINNASCLTNCSTSCTVPGQPGAITGNTSVCSGTSSTYSVTAVPGATSYIWSLPSGWTGSSATNSINVTIGNASGSVSVTASNSCGNSAGRTLAVTVSSVPAQPGTISGSSAVCSGTSQSYSISAVSGATSYTWTLPAGWSGSSTTNLINVTTGASGGTISVKANNTCGSGITRTLSVTITASGPAQPGTISGPASVCAGAVQTYSVSAVSGATSYAWTLPAGWSGSSSTNSISVTSGSIAGNISVSAANGCGTSAARVLAVGISTAPDSAGTITLSGGSATVCTGDIRTYTVPLVSGVTYNWVVPTGANINSGQGSNSINVSFTSSFSSSGTLSVRKVNSCGSGPARTITISRTVVARPGIISVNITGKVCPGNTRIYSVPAVSGITYNWIPPTGAVITSGQGSPSINISFNSNFTATGILRVTANNSCGTSAERTRTIARKSSCTSGFVESKGTPQILSGSTDALIYPNPTNDIANVKFFSEDNSLFTLTVKDITGKTLIMEKHPATTGLNIHSFSLSRMAKGTYLVLVESSKTKKVLKISVQ